MHITALILILFFCIGVLFLLLNLEPKKMKSLVLLRHVPGAGSTTFGKLIGDPISADHFFEDKDGNYNFDATKLHEAHQWCANETEARMKRGAQLVIVANTFVEEWQITRYSYLAKVHNYMFISLIVENRHGGKDIHNVPPETIEKMKRKFDIKL